MVVVVAYLLLFWLVPLLCSSSIDSRGALELAANKIDSKQHRQIFV
jgi:hypothetical protein